jgi:hypothetical protein
MLERDKLCIVELQGSVIQPFSHMHFIQARDHIGISTTRMMKLLVFLHSLKVSASKVLPPPGAYKIHCSYVRSYIKDEIKINFDTSLAGSCVVPFESIFPLWIEAILEAGETLNNNTLWVRTCWDDRPKVRWGNMVFSAVPLHSIFPPQLWKSAFPFACWQGKESLDDYKLYCKSLESTFRMITENNWSVEVKGQRYYCKPIASPDLKALFSTHSQPSPGLNKYIFCTDLLHHLLMPDYKIKKPEALVNQIQATISRSPLYSTLVAGVKAYVLGACFLSEEEFNVKLASFPLAGSYNFNSQTCTFDGVEMCWVCFCCKHQVAFSLAFPWLQLWNPTERHFENYFHFLHIVLCLLHANQRMVEKLLSLLTNSSDVAYQWLVSRFFI